MPCIEKIELRHQNLASYCKVPERGALDAERFPCADCDFGLEMLDKVAETTRLYLEAQIAAGAEIVQLFDSAAFALPRRIYEDLALKYARKVIGSLSHTGVPIIYFAPGSMTSLESMAGLGAQVIGLDFRIDLGKARDLLGINAAVQGNLDPGALLGTSEATAESTRQVLQRNAGRPGHIFNLGHGVLPSTSIDNVEAMLRTIRDYV